MPATALDSAIFRDIFSTRGDARRLLRRNRIALLSRDRGGAGARAGRARHHPRAGRARDRCKSARSRTSISPGSKATTERIGYPILGVVQQIVGALRQGARANGAIGARPPRTSPTPRPSCRSARRSIWSRRTWRRSPPRSPTCRGATATRRWRAAAICSRRCRSPSASRRPRCSPPCSATASGWQQMRPRVLVGEFAGAVGTLVSLGADGLKVQAGADGRARPRPA